MSLFLSLVLSMSCEHYVNESNCTLLGIRLFARERAPLDQPWVTIDGLWNMFPCLSYIAISPNTQYCVHLHMDRSHTVDDSFGDLQKLPLTPAAYTQLEA